MSELAQNDDQRQFLEFLSGDVAVGRPVLTTPDVPAARLRALRKAFDDMLNDPAFRTAAGKANLYLNPRGGESSRRS